MMVLNMKIKKRFVQGVGKKGGKYEGYQILNDESDGTFYPIKDSERNVSILCKKLNSLTTPEILEDMQQIRYYTQMNSKHIHVFNGTLLYNNEDCVDELNRLYNLFIMYEFLYKSNQSKIIAKDIQIDALRKENEILNKQVDKLQDIVSD